MTFILACRKSIEANIGAAVASCCDVAIGQLPDDQTNHLVFESKSLAGRALVLSSEPDEVMTQQVVIIPLPVPRLFTWLDPITSMERLRPFFRGVLRSAIAIWSKDRKYGIDFDQDGIFYRRPFAARDDLWHQTLVMVDVPHHSGPGTRAGLQDLALIAFGQADEGLPLLESFKSVCADPLNESLGKIRQVLDGLKPEQLTQLRQIAPSVPLVTTLEGVRVPAWFSYDQWMRKLAGTPQETFITSPLSGPQRVDGPAGSGKTLSLVLKCLYTLKEAAKQNKAHHSALVVFSEETKRKIIDSSIAPLDEDGFYTRERSPGVSQSLTVTTLLEWSRKELEPVVGPFELPSDNAAQARVDQQELVKDTLDRNLAAFLKGGGAALSHNMRTLCVGGVSPVLVEMFLHEFGVVIKGMADGSVRRYLTTTRPTIALPCTNEADRRFVFALFEKYEDLLREYGVVDLDDVAVSHIKLLQMPLRREVREGLAFDSVFVDEAHSFNPNELAIFFLLTRRAELPSLVVAVDLPQALGDKGYEGKGLEKAIFEEFEAREQVPITRFLFDDVRRCPQAVLDLVASIYAQGYQFLAPMHVPRALRSARTDATKPPIARQFRSQPEMLEGAFAVAEEIVARLHCSRSEVLIVLMHEGLQSNIPQRLASRAEILTKRTDSETEQRAQRLNHFIIARPEYLHGLDYEAVVLVGLSRDELPRLEHAPIGGGAAAMFETQRVVDLLYLALTRARREVMILYVRAPSFLLQNGMDRGLLAVETVS